MKSLVSVKWLSENFNAPDLVVLDVSLKSNASNLEVQFPSIQIKGARFFDMKGCFSDKESNIPNMIPNVEVFTSECQKLGINKTSTIVIYDNLGIYSSPRVWWMFKIMGHENIAVLDGGLPAWKHNDLACELIQETPVKSGNFEANYQSKLVKSAEEVSENVTTKEALVVDARSKKRFEGIIPESRKNLKSGHIPNSLNLPFLELLNNGHFLSEEKLIQKFKLLNLKNKPLIFTCGSGIIACVLLLASKLVLENTVSLYDGSWSEWGQFDDSFIEK